MTAAAQIVGVFAATPTQRAMLGGADPARDYLSHVVLDLQGPLDAACLQHAWQQIVRRHAVLRTGFVRDASQQIFQVVRQEVMLELELLQAGDAQAVERRIAEDRRLGLRLDTPALMRLALWPAGAGCHRLVWCHHHAILDGWSLHLLLAEVIEAYRALRECSRPNLPAVQGFDSYLLWARRRDAGADLAFWKDQLGGFGLPVAIGRASLTVPGAAARYAGVDRAAGAHLAQRLQRASQRWRVTPALLLQAATAACLAHLSGQDDVVLGTTRSGRPSTLADADRIAGPFLVTTPLRVTFRRDAALGDWVHRLSLAASQVDEHAHLDPLRIQQQSDVPLDRALFECAVVVQNYASGTQRLAGAGLVADVRTLRVEGGEGSFPLLVSASLDDQLHLRLRNDLHRVPPEEADSVATALVALLEGLVDDDCTTVQQWLARAPARSGGLWRQRVRTPAAWSAPVGDTETLVARVWSRLAGRPVGRDEDFFAAGGHSLLALELAAGLTEALAKPVSLQLIYAHRSVRAIAATLDGLAVDEGAGSPGAQGSLQPNPAARHEPFPMTPLQRAYWIGRRAAFALGGRGSYAMVEVRLDPRIDVRRIEPAWNRLVRRHPMLRAVVTADGMQRVLPAAAHVEVPCWDLAVGSPVQGLQELRATLRRQVEDVHGGPLFALALSRVAGSTQLHVAYDPIVCDAGSFALLAQELGQLVHDPEAGLPDIGLDFRDYVLACVHMREVAAGARDRSYWERRLDLLPPAPELPVRPDQDPEERFARRQLQLAAPAFGALKDLCATLSVTPSALLIGAYALVVAAWARRRHFCLNLTLFNRRPLHGDVHRLVGDFTTLTLLETDLRQAGTLAQAARQVQDQLAADLDHRWVDGVDVLRWLSGRQGGQPVLMPVVFTSTLGHAVASSGSAALGEVVRGYGQTPQVYLDCQVMEHEGALHCWWDSLDGMFPPGMVDEMFASFERLLDLAAHDTSFLHRAAPMLSEDSRQARLALNATAAPCPEATLDGLFVAQAARTPSNLAVIAPDRCYTYAELERATARLASQIAQQTRPEEPVAVLTPLDGELALASLAVLRAGRALVRLSPEWPAARSLSVLEITGAALVLVHAGAAPLPLPPCTRPLGIEADGGAAVVQGWVDASRPETLAYVMFTSGSTGEPKGIAITHRAAVNTVVDINRRLRAEARDRVLAISAGTFDLSIYDLFGMLAVGGAAVYVQPQRRSDPAHWLDVMSEHAVTLWNSTPALMDMLAEQMSMAPPAQRPPLRAAMLSGDWIPVALAPRIRAHWPGLRVVGLGGATEAAIWSVWHEIDAALPGWPSVPYGAPLANQTTQVLDSLLQPCPDWAIGDLYIGGAGLAQGYFRRPDLTEASFVTHPDSGERLYRTGDLARLRPGAMLEFLGREDGQVKVRGYRIELGEIEFHLGRQPGVAQAAVVVHHNTLRAFFVADGSGAAADPQEMRHGLAEVLAPYAVPTSIRRLDAMPLTANGKVDRVALVNAVARGSAIETGTGGDTVATLVARVAQEVLQADAITLDDDLFLVGADSVSALQITSRLRAETGRRVELAAVFALRTPRALAEAIRAQAELEDDRVEPCPADAPIPASSMQQRLWLLDRVEPGDPRYIIPGAVPLGASVDLQALRAALADLLERHEPLRTTLHHTPAGLVQVIHPAPGSPLDMLDAAVDGDAPAQSFDDFARRPFDLGEHLPARFRLVSRPDGSRVLQFAIHHVAVDAWSMGVMADDLARLYAARRGRGQAPPPLPVRYADFAHWEQRRLSAARFAQAQAWWNHALRALPAQAFVDGRPPQAGPVVVPVRLDRDTTRALRACAERTGATLYMVLLSLFAAALRHQGAPADLAIASSTNGRIRPELEPLVGCFVNLVLVRVDVGGDVPLDELVGRVRAFALDAYAHQDLPFELALAAARRGQGQGSTPYAAVFVLQNNPARTVKAGDIDLRLKDLDLDGSRYPIHLHLGEADDGLQGALRGEGSPLSSSRMSALAGDFARLARGACAQPGRSLRALLADGMPDGDALRAAQQQRLAALLQAADAGRGP